MGKTIEPGQQVDELARVTLSAAVEVHKQLGPDYLESVYEEALAIELSLSEISFQRQVAISLHYKNRPVGQGRLDFLVGDQLVVELKAVDALLPIHKAQMLSYLKTTGNQLGLLINFNVTILMRGVQRVVLSYG